MGKRIFDIFFSLLVLLVTSPVLLITALLVKVSSPGPVFFTQERAGLKGKVFNIIKFRSMFIESGNTNSFQPGNLSRITPIGRVLRRYKIDELPQFVNVLRGEMSVVGPRPEVLYWTRFYPENWSKVLTIRPGLTDNASIEYSDEESILAGSHDPEKTYREEILPKKLKLYNDYIDNHSIYGDLKIIFMTIKKTFRNE